MLEIASHTTPSDVRLAVGEIPRPRFYEESGYRLADSVPSQYSDIVLEHRGMFMMQNSASDERTR